MHIIGEKLNMYNINSTYNSLFRVLVYFFRTWLPEMVFFLIPGELLKWQKTIGKTICQFAPHQGYLDIPDSVWLLYEVVGADRLRGEQEFLDSRYVGLLCGARVISKMQGWNLLQMRFGSELLNCIFACALNDSLIVWGSVTDYRVQISRSQLIL